MFGLKRYAIFLPSLSPLIVRMASWIPVHISLLFSFFLTRHRNEFQPVAQEYLYSVDCV